MSANGGFAGEQTSRSAPPESRPAQYEKLVRSRDRASGASESFKNRFDFADHAPQLLRQVARPSFQRSIVRYLRQARYRTRDREQEY